MNKTRIILADDHQMFLDGLTALLTQIENVQIVTTANNGAKLLDALEHHETDLVIMDLHMPVMNGFETAQQIRKRFPELKVMALTMDNDMESIKHMLDQGISGYVLKNTGKAELELAINQIMQGENYLSNSVGNLLAQNLLLNKQPPQETEVHQLTEREIEILKMIAAENSNAEIADKLFISPKTVETHRKNLMKKIGVKNSLGVYKFAVKNKLI